MQVLCPQCFNPIEMTLTAPAAGGAEIVCPACGSSFALEQGSTSAWDGGGPRRFGRFELLRVVGTGAFGTVYKARDAELDRVVAVKVPRAGSLTAAADRDRFLREARSVAQLSHPSIVTVHEVGQQEGVPFLVSDFVNGTTLADVLTARRLTFTEAARLVAAVAEALQYAHERGVVHRDVKPSNVMLDEAGRPRLMDFGLARRDAGEITMTLEGQVLGTPAYMSPEQARGEAHQVDGRSDVYSLGVILYQLLTGELPFRGNTRMLLHQVLHDEPRPPRRLNDCIPRDLETICLKAMAKEPARRYQSARDLADDLQRFLKGEPIRARPVGRLERVRKWARRRPAAAALVAVSGLSLALLVGGLTAGLLLLEERRSQAEDALTRERQANEDKDRAHRGEQRLSYFQRIASAHRDLRVNNARRADQSLADCPADLRGWEWRYLHRACHGEMLALAEGAPGLWWDGPWATTDMWPLPLPLVGQTSWLNDNDYVFMACCGRDGASLAVLDREGTRVLDPRTGKVLGRLGCRLPRDLTEGFRHIILGPGGRYAAEVLRVDPKEKSWPAQVRVWDVASGRPLYEFHDKERPEVAAGFSPDGAHLVTVSAGFTGRDRQLVPGQVRVCEAAGGRELAPPLPAEDFKTGPLLAEFSPDGRKLVLSGQASDAIILDVKLLADVAKGKVETLVLEGLKGLRGVPVFSPDGKLLAGRVERDGRKEVQVWDLSTGREERTLPGAEAALAFSPEGRRLATWQDGQGVGVWDIASGLALVQIKMAGNSSQAYACQFCTFFSPDGRLLMVPGANGTAFWDALSGEHRFTVPGVTFTRFSPDGTRLLGCDWSGVKVWDRLAVEQPTAVLPPCEDGRTAAFSPATGRTALADGAGIRLLEAAGRELTALRGHTRPVCCLAFSADGERLASAAQDLSAVDHTAEIKVWDLRAGRELFTLTRPADYAFTHLTFSPDGRSLAVTEDPGDLGHRRNQIFEGDKLAAVVAGRPVPPQPSAVVARVEVREASTGRERFSLRFTGLLRGPAVFAAGGDRLAVVAGNRLAVHDTATGREVRSADLLPVPDPNVIVRLEPWATAWAVFSPDGNTLAVFVEDGGRKPGEVQLWDVPRAEQRHRLSTPASLQRAELYPRPVGPRGRPLAWGPAGTRLAACHGEDVAIWEVATARLIHRLVTGAPVKRLAWTPDGQRLVTAGDGEKGQVKLWDAETGAEVLTLKEGGTAGSVDLLGFRPDGGLLVLGLGRFHVLEAAPHSSDWAAWHLVQAEQAVRDEGQIKDDTLKTVRGPVLRFAVASHLRHLEGLDFDSADLSHRRGALYAHLGRWTQAAADFRRAVERKTDQPEAYCYLALLALKAGDRDAYRRTCRLMLERLPGLRGRGWARPGPTEPRFLTCRTCTLADGALDDYTPLIRLAEKVGPVSLGPALYRAGEVARAEEVLRKALTADDATIHLFLRQAKHRQGKKADISAELEEARKQMAKEPKPVPAPPASDALTEWAGAMEWAMLQAEAEERLRTPPAKQPGGTER